jgi:hypothetical protein
MAHPPVSTAILTFSLQAPTLYNVTVARNTFIWAVYNLLFKPSLLEDMDGHVPPVRANTRRRLINTMCAILHHPLHAEQMLRRRGVGDVPERTGPRPSERRIFRSSTSTYGLSDILGEFTCVLRDLCRSLLRDGVCEYADTFDDARQYTVAEDTLGELT